MRSLVKVFLPLALVLAAAPALAGGSRDDVHADSFGNLVVVSPSGYKRIVVGQGYLADELRDYTQADDSDAAYEVYADGRRYGRPCPAILVKGRSYMYGFDQGVIPLFGDRCL